MKKRLLYIDRFKGIAILLVVMGHFIQENTIESVYSPIFSWIYSFHMQVFMFISGYVAYKTTTINSVSDCYKFLKKKSIGLLVPYFIWPLIVNKFFFSNSDQGLKKLLAEAWFLTGHWQPLWFLWMLFFLLLNYAVFNVLSNWLNKRISFIVDLFLFLFISSALVAIKIFHMPFPLRIESYLLFYLFFFTGVFVSKFEILSKLALNELFFTVMFLVFILMSGRFDYLVLSSEQKLLKIVISFAAIFTLYYIVNKIEWNATIDKYIQQWGTYSIVIYTTHFTMIKLTTSVAVFNKLGLLALFIVSLVFAFIIISACMLLYKVIRLSSVIDFLLYGHFKKSPK
jgi:fucose 4-O-acetylase-like acetyltransferase